MTVKPDALLLARLRGWRNRPQPDLSFRPVAAAMTADLRSRARTLGHAGEAWLRLVPPELLDQTSLLSMARGVLTVRVSDASARSDLARWLRQGGEHAVIRATPGSLIKVRLVP
jgi:hypothetical protein